MYAEALNELDGSYQIETWDNSGTHSISRNEDELKKGVQPVRIRAGIPDFTPEEYGNKELFRKKIKRERQIELMAEGQRYFDLRRWKTAEKDLNQPLMGFRIERQDNGVVSTHEFVVDGQRKFNTKMYYSPIPYSEMQLNTNLVQNPGWR